MDHGAGWHADPRRDSGADEFHVLPLGATRTMGSHKGYSLAMLVDILSGVLSGVGPGFLNTGSASHHFIAYRIDAFTDYEKFLGDMDTYLRGLRETPTAPGNERVMYAGLGSHEAEEERRELGIPYHPDVVAYYKGLAKEMGFEDVLP